MQLEMTAGDAATIPGGIESIQVKLHHVHTMVESAGSVEFSVSSAEGRTLNKIQRGYLQTQRNNLHSIPTDCPSEWPPPLLCICAPIRSATKRGCRPLCSARFGA